MIHVNKIYVLVMAFLIAYGAQACYYFSFSAPVYELAQYTGRISTELEASIVICSTIVIIFLCDSYFGLYQTIVFGLLFMILIPLCNIVCLLHSLALKLRTYFYKASRLYDGVYLSFSGLMHIALMEQFDLPEELVDLRRFTFYYFELTTFAAFLNEYFMPKETAEFAFAKMIAITLTLLIVCFILIRFHKLIKTEPIYFRMVEKCLDSIYIALRIKCTNKASNELSKDLHWIYYAQKEHPLLVLESTRQCLSMIKFVIFYGAFLCFYVLNGHIILIQSQLIGRTLHWELNMSLRTLMRLLVLFFVPICEFVFVPLLKNFTIFKNNLQFIGISYVLLLISMCYSIYLQVSIQQHAAALPALDSAQLRFYNCLPERVTIKTQHNETLHIKPHGLLSMLRIYGNGKVLRNFTLLSSFVNETKTITTVAGHSFTVIISSTGMDQSFLPDPMYYNLLKSNITQLLYTLVLMVHSLKTINGYLGFAGHKGEASLIRLHSDITQPFALVPAGTYFLTYRDENFRSFHKLDTKATLRVGGIYSALVYRNMSNDTTAKVFTLMEPITIHWKYLFPQVIFAVLAYSFILIPWMIFTYVEAPKKLRATVYGITTVCAELLTNFLSMESALMKSVHYTDKLYLSIGFLLSSWVLFMYFAANYTYVKWFTGGSQMYEF